MTKYSKDYLSFDLQSELIEAVGDGKGVVNREKLEKLLSKLNATMIKQLETMLYGELVKTVSQTTVMLGALVKTHSLIRESKQYRESLMVKNATDRINEYLTQANACYEAAKDEIDRIQNTPGALPSQYILGKVALHLERAKFESDCAQKELETVLRDVSEKLQSMASRRTSHGVDIGLSAINATVTAVQYTFTPSILLSNVAKTLFAANEGLHIVNTVGHCIGFYWSYEEIQKLEELQNEMRTLEADMKNSLEKISYGMAKLERIKQHVERAADPTMFSQN